MTDLEIKEYLDQHHWSVNAQECVIKVFNTSYQIYEKYYDADNDMMTIVTPENTFTFKWILRKLKTKGPSDYENEIK